MNEIRELMQEVVAFSEERDPDLREYLRPFFQE